MIEITPVLIVMMNHLPGKENQAVSTATREDELTKE
jgi:hypothetical protein